MSATAALRYEPMDTVTHDNHAATQSVDPLDPQAEARIASVAVRDVRTEAMALGARPKLANALAISMQAALLGEADLARLVLKHAGYPDDIIAGVIDPLAAKTAA